MYDINIQMIFIYIYKLNDIYIYTFPIENGDFPACHLSLAEFFFEENYLTIGTPLPGPWSISKVAIEKYGGRKA